MTRPMLIGLMTAKLPRRFQRWLEADGVTVRVVGMFKPPGFGRWYIAVRIKRPRKLPVWVRIYEAYRATTDKRETVVIADQPPVWRHHRAEGMAGDCFAAVRRLADRDARTAVEESP